MKNKALEVLTEKTKYLIEIKPGSQYLFVFDRTAGLDYKALASLGDILENEYDVKIMSILVDNIEGMRVLSLEEKL